MSRSAQNRCLDYARCFSSPNPLSSLSLATNMSKASRKKNGRARAWSTIDRSIDSCPMGCSLAENTRPPRHICPSQPYAATCEEENFGHLRPSGLQAPTAGMERRDWKKKKKGPSPYYEYNARSLYTERCTATRVTLPCCWVALSPQGTTPARSRNGMLT